MIGSTQQFVRLLDEKNIKYKLGSPTESGKDTMTVTYGGENMSSIRCSFYFSDDGEDVAIRVFDIVKVPENKVNAMIHVVNALNNRFRFAKFCLYTKDNTVQAEMDGAFRSHDVGEIVLEMMVRMVDICDKAYPDLMKALWS